MKGRRRLLFTLTTASSLVIGAVLVTARTPSVAATVTSPHVPQKR